MQVYSAVPEYGETQFTVLLGVTDAVVYGKPVLLVPTETPLEEQVIGLQTAPREV
jgi:hypothetical protein